MRDLSKQRLHLSAIIDGDETDIMDIQITERTTDIWTSPFLRKLIEANGGGEVTAHRLANLLHRLAERIDDMGETFDIIKRNHHHFMKESDYEDR